MSTVQVVWLSFIIFVIRNKYALGIYEPLYGNFTANIECPEGKSCVIDCSDDQCQGKLIWGRLATDLWIDCNSFAVCQHTDIYCPETLNASCNIFCGANESCQNTTIYGNATTAIYIDASNTYSFLHATVYANNAHQINLKCSGQQSCHFATIHAAKANNVNVTCMGYKGDSSITSYATCYSLNVQAQFVSNEININCIQDKFSCNYASFYTDNAKKVKVLGNGYCSMSQARIYAADASNFELTCIGKAIVYGCYWAVFFLPERHVTIKCFGYGCSDIYMAIHGGMTALASTSNSMVINSCEKCSLYDCVSAWMISCSYAGGYDGHSTISHGTSCSNRDQCDCLLHHDLLAKKYITNVTQELCKTLIPTPAPTAMPTAVTNQPTFGPSEHPTIAPTSMPTAPPSYSPTHEPTELTKEPTTNPTGSPTSIPTVSSTFKPTISPTFRPTISPTSSPTFAEQSSEGSKIGEEDVTLFIIVASIMLCLCIIGSIVLCVKCNGKDKIPLQKLREVEDVKVREFELQPVSENIRQQMNMHINDGNISADKQKYTKLKEDA